MAESQLEVRDLSMHFPLRGGLVRRLRGEPSAVLRAVDGVDLEIARGEALGLVGESGCGKSTLGRCIVGLYTPTSGTIRLAGEDITDLDREQMLPYRKRMQMIYQDPYASLNPRMSAGEMVAEPMQIHQVNTRKERRERSRVQQA